MELDMPHGKIVENIQQLYAQLLLQEQDQLGRSLVEQIVATDQKVGIVFAGQGFDFMSDLAQMYEASPKARKWITMGDQLLRSWTKSPEILSQGLFPFGLSPILWIEEQRELPPSYLQSVSVSHSLIFIAQVARLLAAQEDGLQAIFDANITGIRLCTLRAYVPHQVYTK